ncbi:MAG TPA: J domain-containing protein [Vicinamibacterales bacterium]|jgi:hypothetical protein
MSLVLGFIALLGVMAAEASAQEKTPGTPNTPNTSNLAGSSAIEQALAEHACRSQLPGIAGADAYQDCLVARLRSLRADFGRDLSRVSVADRKTLDSACSASRAAEGREAYLECLTLQLVAIKNRRSPSPQASEAAAIPLPLENAEPATLTVPAAQKSSRFSPLWISVGVITLVAGIGGAFLVVKSRRPKRKCRVCGDAVPQAGDLCPKCRHEAAEALRQAAAARANEERAKAEEQRRDSEREEERRRHRARDEEAARVRQQEEARRREEDALRRQKEEEESRQRSRAAGAGDAAEEALDPYTVLGVPRDASREAIDAAHQQGQLKYAPEQVAHLGPELQEHYKRKAEAVERAYKILTE